MPFAMTDIHPETTALIDRCLEEAEDRCNRLGIYAQGPETRSRLAAALLEAKYKGENDNSIMVEFALQALPAYRRLK